MHRVELKVEEEALQEEKKKVPNAPCGVERLKQGLCLLQCDGS